MAGTTTRFSWPYPESTDFVADGATAIENLADAVDASLDGTVLQVVGATYGTSTSVSGSTYADSGLSATITPSSTTSKVLVFFSHPAYISAGGFLYWKLQQNGVDQVIDGDVLYDASYQVEAYVVFQILLSPGSTSALTYKTQLRCPAGTATFQPQNTIATMILMEIAS